jgi:hypothetical protein
VPWPRLALASIVAVPLLLAVAASPRPLGLQVQLLLTAVAQLGPIAGWRCLSEPVYRYDPRRQRPESALVSEAPEAAVAARLDGRTLKVEQVEVHLRGGDTLVRARVQKADGTYAPRVYVLVPGRSTYVSVDLPRQDIVLCNARLGDWNVVGEQSTE